MTSINQTEGNRRNSARSCGPRTTGGKARSSRNAFGHGLSVSILEDPVLSATAQRLAEELAGANPSPARLAQASAIAQCRLELLRLRDAQHTLMEALASEVSVDAVVETLKVALRFHGYERKIISRMKRATRSVLVNSEPQSGQGASGPLVTFAGVEEVTPYNCINWCCLNKL
jgi:hypothetical protein